MIALSSSISPNRFLHKSQIKRLRFHERPTSQGVEVEMLELSDGLLIRGLPND